MVLSVRGLSSSRGITKHLSLNRFDYCDKSANSINDEFFSRRPKYIPDETKMINTTNQIILSFIVFDAA
jgi:hypothetical protein